MPGSTASHLYAKVGAATCFAGAPLNGGLCTDWWQAVAPAEGPVKDNRIQQWITLRTRASTVTAADMKPWWTIVQACSVCTVPGKPDLSKKFQNQPCPPGSPGQAGEIIFSIVQIIFIE